MKTTAVEWLENELEIVLPILEDEELRFFKEAIEQAKEIEKQQKGYSEEEAYKIWKAGQEYWKTSGASITFEELIKQFKNK